MKKDINKYYRKRENGSLELLDDYLLSYSFRRGFLSDENRCSIVDLYINGKRQFEIFLVWYKELSTEFIESYVEGELPETIDKILQELFTFESLMLKESYTDSNDIYSADGIQRESITINHSNENHSIDLSPHYFRENLMQTTQEKLILKMYNEIDQLINASFDKVKSKYT